MRAFVVLGLVFFFHTEPSDWLRKTSPKWPVLCRVGHNVWPQLSQSVNLQQDAQWLCLIWKWWNESMDVQRHSLLWDCILCNTGVCNTGVCSTGVQVDCVQYRWSVGRWVSAGKADWSAAVMWTVSWSPGGVVVRCHANWQPFPPSSRCQLPGRSFTCQSFTFKRSILMLLVKFWLFLIFEFYNFV